MNPEPEDWVPKKIFPAMKTRGERRVLAVEADTVVVTGVTNPRHHVFGAAVCRRFSSRRRCGSAGDREAI
jgi:hypothetical protein